MNDDSRNYKPLTTRQMEQKGWRRSPSKHNHDGYSRCDRCGVAIEWWKSPNKKSVPFDVTDSGDALAPRVCHFDTCQGSRGGNAPSDREQRETIAAQIRKEFIESGPADTSDLAKFKWCFARLVEARMKLANLSRSR